MSLISYDSQSTFVPRRLITDMCCWHMNIDQLLEKQKTLQKLWLFVVARVRCTMCPKRSKTTLAAFSCSQADRQETGVTFAHATIARVLSKFIGTFASIKLPIMPLIIGAANDSQIHKLLIVVAFSSSDVHL